jgi:biopolymer transport protein ExbB
MVLAGLVASSPTAAQEQAQSPAGAVAEQVPPEQRHEPTILEWIYEAEGGFFWPQLAISMAILALIVTNILGLMGSRFVPQHVVDQFEQLVKERKFSDAFELVRNDPSFLGQVVTAGLLRLPDGYQEAIEAMQEVAEEETMKHEHRLSYLAMLANIATMVGLLGTVWGMVRSFRIIGIHDVTPKPSELAQGVSQALVTTIVGLLQAIPAILFFTILRNLLARRVLEVGILSERMMQRFKGVPVQRKPASSKAAETPAAATKEAARE